jgi:ferredoxin/flavodoxin---NADP+ reductase
MFQILSKKDIDLTIKEFDVFAPNIVKNAKAGQFVMVRLDEFSERIPLTIADIDFEKQSIKIILQELGKSTKKLGLLKVGDEIRDVLGPLGEPAEIKNYGNVVVIGGGVGIAAIAPIVKALKLSNNKVTTIVGIRNKSMMMLEELLEKYSDELFLTSNDGSLGEKGFVTDVLTRLFEQKKHIDIIFTVGPLVMMKAVYEMVKEKIEIYKIEKNIPVMVSLEVLMLDGIGMCGACRVKYGEENKFACVDGPIFDASKLDFSDIMNRQKSYKGKEEIALKKWQEEAEHKESCQCKCVEKAKR